MYCPSCGKKISIDSNFCEFCGQTIPQKIRFEAENELSSESGSNNQVWSGDCCELCGKVAPVKYVQLYQNIGAFFRRYQKTIKGKLCRECLNKYFWQFTLTTLAIGWLGVISAFVTPFFIINNIVRYLMCLKLKSIEN